MKIQSNNKDGIIDILYDGFSWFLKIRKPIAVDCYDNKGTVARYYSLLVDDHTAIAHQLDSILLKGSDEEILSEMQQFIQLFDSGEYSVHMRKEDSNLEIHCDFDEYKRDASHIYNYYNPNKENLVFTQHLRNLNRERESNIL